MHIRFAQPADTEQIIGLWQQCFGDSPDFISFYLQHHPFSEKTLLLALEGDVVLSMLSLLPACFLCQGQQLPVRYVYAVGTDIRFRGQGLSTTLLDSAAQICRENNEAGLFLIPASQSLFSFYSARGFYNAFGLQTEMLLPADFADAQPSDEIFLKPIAPEAIFPLRGRILGRHQPFIQWDTKALGYAVSATGAAGGDALGFYQGDTPVGYVFYEPFNGNCVIKEWGVPEHLERAALCALHARLQRPRYVLRRPGQTPYGMLRPVSGALSLPKTLGYTGLILD